MFVCYFVLFLLMPQLIQIIWVIIVHKLLKLTNNALWKNPYLVPKDYWIASLLFFYVNLPGEMDKI